MNTTRLLAHSVRTMARYKLRSSFIMLGSFVGVAALTLVVSIGQAAERKILDTVRQLFGASSIMIVGGGGRFMGGPRAASSRLTLDDIEALAQEIPGIALWDPQQVLSAAAVRSTQETGVARVVGQSERSDRVWDRGVSRGEYFDATAVARSARVALIGETVVRELFPDQDALGEEILIGSVSFRVIGILDRFGTDVHGMDRDDEVIVPISTLMRRMMNVDTIAAAKLLANDADQTEQIATEVRRILRERHALAEGQPDDFSIMTPIQVQRMVGWARRIFALYLPLAAAVSLVVGGIVAASLMLVSVNERVHEIGLRRAVGATAEDIRLQFLIETAITTFSGGIAGIALGYVGAELAANRLHLGDILSWGAVSLGLVSATLTGLVAGVLPAQRAARLEPATALR